MSLLLQSRAVELFMPGEAASEPSTWPALLIVAGVGAAVAAAIVVVRWFNQRDPGMRAFATIARKVGLSRRERKHLREIALARGMQPVALVLCPSSLQRATKGDESPAVRALVLKLLR